jgi:carboxymethylenebutenolidase
MLESGMGATPEAAAVRGEDRRRLRAHDRLVKWHDHFTGTRATRGAARPAEFIVRPCVRRPAVAFFALRSAPSSESDHGCARAAHRVPLDRTRSFRIPRETDRRPRHRRRRHDGGVRAERERFARAGYMALAPDIYHGDTFDYADREGAIARLDEVDDDVAMREVGASLDMLASQGARDGRLGIIGFCMGGRLAFLGNAVHGQRLAASVSFYGGGIAPAVPRGKRKPLIDRVEELSAPQLLIYGARDASIASDEHARIAKALSDANKRYTLAVLPDAPHAFATFDRDSYHASAAEAAWRIAFAFFVDTFMHGSGVAYA